MRHPKLKRASKLQLRFNNVSYYFKAEAEVERLDHLKASKMKELFLKKQIELEEICNRSHMEIPSQSEMDNIMNLINSGKMKFCFPKKKKNKQKQDLVLAHNLTQMYKRGD